MKKKKTIVFFLSSLLFIGFLLACIFRPVNRNDLYDKPQFRGIVTAVYDKQILVSVDKDEDEFKSSDKMSVSLTAKRKDSRTKFKIGDSIIVFYDGTIAESYPAQINTVYAILLANE